MDGRTDKLPQPARARETAAPTSRSARARAFATALWIGWRAVTPPPPVAVLPSSSARSVRYLPGLGPRWKGRQPRREGALAGGI